MILIFDKLPYDIQWLVRSHALVMADGLLDADKVDWQQYLLKVTEQVRRVLKCKHWVDGLVGTMTEEIADKGWSFDLERRFLFAPGEERS